MLHCDCGRYRGEYVVTAAQRKKTFRANVEYVTSPGDRVSCVISTHGRFEKRDTARGAELVLTAWFASAAPDEATAIEAIRERCGWQLQIEEGLERLEPATPREIGCLRAFDPERVFLGRTRR